MTDPWVPVTSFIEAEEADTAVGALRGAGIPARAERGGETGVLGAATRGRIAQPIVVYVPMSLVRKARVLLAKK